MSYDNFINLAVKKGYIIEFDSNNIPYIYDDSIEDLVENIMENSIGIEFNCIYLTDLRKYKLTLIETN